jgi:hypothetical protein
VLVWVGGYCDYILVFELGLFCFSRFLGSSYFGTELNICEGEKHGEEGLDRSSLVTVYFSKRGAGGNGRDISEREMK